MFTCAIFYFFFFLSAKPFRRRYCHPSQEQLSETFLRDFVILPYIQYIRYAFVQTACAGSCQYAGRCYTRPRAA